MSVDGAQASVVLYDPNRDIRIRSIQFVSVLDGDTNTCQNLQAGISTDLDKYCLLDPSEVAVENALGTSQVATLLSSDLLSAGTALIVSRVSGSSTNTWECVAIVTYEFVDRTLSH